MSERGCQRVCGSILCALSVSVRLFVAVTTTHIFMFVLVESQQCAEVMSLLVRWRLAAVV